MKLTGVGYNDLVWEDPLENGINGSARCLTVHFGMYTPTTTGGDGYLARESAKVADMKALVDADLAVTHGGTPTAILINLGSADMALGMPTEANFKTNYAYILDAMNTKWPTAAIYCASPWRRTSDADANSIHAWIGDVIATRAPWAQRGPDERIVIKWTDDGATYTKDGLHYSVAGSTVWAAAWRTVLGY